MLDLLIRITENVIIAVGGPRLRPAAGGAIPPADPRSRRPAGPPPSGNRVAGPPQWARCPGEGLPHPLLPTDAEVTPTMPTHPDDPWRDAHGTPIPSQCRIEQVAVDTILGAAPSRLHQHGQVIDRATTRLIVLFDDESALVHIRPTWSASSPHQAVTDAPDTTATGADRDLASPAAPRPRSHGDRLGVGQAHRTGTSRPPPRPPRRATQCPGREPANPRGPMPHLPPLDLAAPLAPPPLSLPRVAPDPHQAIRRIRPQRPPPPARSQPAQHTADDVVTRFITSGSRRLSVAPAVGPG